MNINKHWIVGILVLDGLAIVAIGILLWLTPSADRNSDHSTDHRHTQQEEVKAPPCGPGVEEALSLTRSSDAEIRHQAVKALGSLWCDRVEDRLMVLITDKERDVWLTASGILADHGSKHFFDEKLKLLTTAETRGEKHSAAGWLDHRAPNGYEQPVAELLKKLREEGDEDGIYERLLRYFRNRNTHLAAEVRAVELLATENFEHRSAVVGTYLSSLHTDDLSLIFDTVKTLKEPPGTEETQQLAERIVKKITDTLRSTPARPMTPLLLSEDSDVREAAMEIAVLMTKNPMDAESVVEAVVPLLDSDDSKVRMTALRTLSDIKDPIVAEHVINFCERTDLSDQEKTDVQRLHSKFDKIPGIKSFYDRATRTRRLVAEEIERR